MDVMLYVLIGLVVIGSPAVLGTIAGAAHFCPGRPGWRMVFGPPAAAIGLGCLTASIGGLVLMAFVFTGSGDEPPAQVRASLLAGMGYSALLAIGPMAGLFATFGGVGALVPAVRKAAPWLPLASLWTGGLALVMGGLYWILVEAFGATA